MPKEKFVLVSLKESKAKQLAQIISNESCRKILDYLADNEATESELAKKLNLPISTVHYNLQNLSESGLIIAEEFHYSEKGKEVYHYKLANKYIIIAPKTTFGIKEKLKTILPVTLLIAAGAGFIQIFSKYFLGQGVAKQLAAAPSTREAIMEVEKTATADLLEEAAPLAAKAPEIAQNLTEVATSTTFIPASPFSNIALWFLIGAVFAVVLYLIISKIVEKE
ncbi:helix-turn-helix transcriptional regulator [archaeon AH-315-M20]|nr:helix-turn-helix transcriptional regulator [archaeon AH-315-M20]